MTKTGNWQLYSSTRPLRTATGKPLNLGIDYASMERKLLANFPDIREYMSAMRDPDFDSKARPIAINKPLLWHGVVHIVAFTNNIETDLDKWRWRTWCGEIVDQPGYDKLNLTPTCMGCIANKE